MRCNGSNGIWNECNRQRVQQGFEDRSNSAVEGAANQFSLLLDRPTGFFGSVSSSTAFIHFGDRPRRLPPTSQEQDRPFKRFPLKAEVRENLVHCPYMLLRNLPSVIVPEIIDYQDSG